MYHKELDQVLRSLSSPVIPPPRLFSGWNPTLLQFSIDVIPTVCRMITPNNLQIRKGDFFGSDADIIVFNKVANKFSW